MLYLEEACTIMSWTNITLNGWFICIGLRKAKDDVDKVKRSEDCGLGLAGLRDIDESNT